MVKRLVQEQCCQQHASMYGRRAAGNNTDTHAQQAAPAVRGRPTGQERCGQRHMQPGPGSCLHGDGSLQRDPSCHFDIKHETECRGDQCGNKENIRVSGGCHLMHTVIVVCCSAPCNLPLADGRGIGLVRLWVPATGRLQTSAAARVQHCAAHNKEEHNGTADEALCTCLATEGPLLQHLQTEAQGSGQ